MHFLRRFSDNCPLKVKMISYIALPDEIMEDIISRLPPKSVGQCRCVCKLWQAIIGRPEFIRVHCNRIRNLREEPLIFTSYKFKEKSFFYDAHLTSAHQVFDKITVSATKLSFADYIGSWTRVYASCHGLLFVGEDMHKTFVLNPTTGEAREVSRWRSTLDRWKSCIVYGFGYDSIGDDYKIVIVSFYRDLNAGVDYAETFVNVYSLKTGTWKSVESPFYWHPDTSTSPGVFVDGSIHWIACNASDCKPTIVAFDLAKETFCEAPPPSLVGDMLVCSHLVALGGYLCMYNIQEIDDWAVKEEIDIWVMKEYGIRESWIRFTVSSLGALFDFRPLCMVGQDQVVVLKDDEELIMCDLKEGTFKDIVVQGIPNKRILARNFVESLVSPNGTYDTGEC